ncbi:MAG: DUF934 domain-containing protein, partial [Gammaproteobacteria bacterium]
MRVIKDNRIIEDDWSRIAVVEPGQAIPADGDLILPFSYWKENQETLSNRSGNTAVCLNGDDNIEELAGYLEQFSLIALDFPLFKDGRCYSHARLLRDRYAYQGDIRAVGDVLRDQLFYMKRCGISSFHVREDKDIEDALKAFQDFTVKYQPAA